MTAPLDEYQLAARRMREAVRNKAYRAYPLGQDGAAFLRWKRGTITDATYKDIESFLDKLARFFPDLEIADFEPPVGTERIEEFLDFTWGDRAPRTYNKNLTWAREFFKWAVLKGKLHGDPTMHVRSHKRRDVLRTTFSGDSLSAIYADGPEEATLYRDRVALHLLLDYGFRKGALQNLRYDSFDTSRRVVHILTKGQRRREIELVQDGLWRDLELAKMQMGAEPRHFFMCRRKAIWRGYNEDGSSRFEVKNYPEHPMGAHGLHNWWYGCLQRAGVVAEGVTSGEKMHKARHTAGQRWLDAGENIKAVQRLLGHADASTTLGTYLDWDSRQVAESARRVLGDD